MTSVTIRRLDETVKRRLALRAASAGRSLEEELRQVLADAVVPLPPDRPAGAPSPPAAATLGGKRILLIVAGGIAAYKSLDLIRRLRERGAEIRAVMTRAAAEFVTPLSVGALTGTRVFTELFDRDDEHDVGHIRLAREADLIVIAPATADILARMAEGRADDLATAVLLAADKPVLAAPAMNPQMWRHPATQRNLTTLRSDRV